MVKRHDAGLDAGTDDKHDEKRLEQSGPVIDGEDARLAQGQRTGHKVGDDNAYQQQTAAAESIDHIFAAGLKSFLSAGVDNERVGENAERLVEEKEREEVLSVSDTERRQ